ATSPPSTHLPLCFHAPSDIQIYSLSLHDALPILSPTFSVFFIKILCNHSIVFFQRFIGNCFATILIKRNIKLFSKFYIRTVNYRSEEHTSELQSRENLVCRLLLEKKKKNL